MSQPRPRSVTAAIWLLMALVALSALTALPRSWGMRTPTDPLDGTIADCQAGLRRGEWTAEEVTRRALERCRRDGAAWRAIDALSATALDEARASDARRRAGTLRGPLDGVPVFAKSIYDMEGLPTTGSSAEWAYLFPGAVHRDALEVRRLRAAGAIVLGKSNVPQGMLSMECDNAIYGATKNPWSAAHVTGGSSSGEGALIASGAR